MRVRLWHGVAGATLLSYAVVVGYETLPGAAVVEGHLLAVLVALGAAMALALVADLGVHGGRLAWAPSVGLWAVLALVPLVNVAVGTAYCLRRWVGARRRPLGGPWVLVLWFAWGSHAAFLANAFVLPAELLAPATDDLVAVLGFTGWLLLPGIVLVELFHALGIESFAIRRRTVTALTAIPLLNLVVVAGIVFKRDAQQRATDDDTFDALAASEFEESPWFRRAGYVFAAAAAATLAALATGPDVGRLTSLLFVHLVWPPFGLAFAACVQRDVSWQRRRGWDVEHDTWRAVAIALVFLFATSYLFQRAKRSDRETDPAT